MDVSKQSSTTNFPRLYQDFFHAYLRHKFYFPILGINSFLHSLQSSKHTIPKFVHVVWRKMLSNFFYYILLHKSRQTLGLLSLETQSTLISLPFLNSSEYYTTLYATSASTSLGIFITIFSPSKYVRNHYFNLVGNGNSR